MYIKGKIYSKILFIQKDSLLKSYCQLLKINFLFHLLKNPTIKKHISPFHTGIYVFNLLFSSSTKNQNNSASTTSSSSISLHISSASLTASCQLKTADPQFPLPFHCFGTTPDSGRKERTVFP